MADAPRIVLVSTMKNEGPYLLEWLAYHRAIGIEEFCSVLEQIAPNGHQPCYAEPARPNFGRWSGTTTTPLAHRIEWTRNGGAAYSRAGTHGLSVRSARLAIADRRTPDEFI